MPTETGITLKNVASCNIKGPFSGLRQFLLTENPLKMMKNAFYFMLTVFFVLELFRLLF